MNMASPQMCQYHDERLAAEFEEIRSTHWFVNEAIKKAHRNQIYRHLNILLISMRIAPLIWHAQLYNLNLMET